MILFLKKPIKDSKGKSVKKLEYDFNDLTMKDLDNAESLYFSLTQGVVENIIYKDSDTFLHLLFFIACAKKNTDLSFVKFMQIKGRDAKNIIDISRNNFLDRKLFDKKKG